MGCCGKIQRQPGRARGNRRCSGAGTGSGPPPYSCRHCPNAPANHPKRCYLGEGFNAEGLCGAALAAAFHFVSVAGAPALEVEFVFSLRNSYFTNRFFTRFAFDRHYHCTP
jgi:hypothetical protein